VNSLVAYFYFGQVKWYSSESGSSPWWFVLSLERIKGLGLGLGCVPYPKSSWFIRLLPKFQLQDIYCLGLFFTQTCGLVLNLSWHISLLDDSGVGEDKNCRDKY